MTHGDDAPTTFRPIAFVYFDLGKVLLDFSHERSCERMAALTGLSASRVRGVVYNTPLEHAYERGDITSREFHERFCEATGTRPGYEALREACADMFSVIHETHGIVARLHDRGHRLGILSNTCEAHWARCVADYPLLTERFLIHALSYELRSTKPEPDIYRAAAAMAGAAPREIFFTDDRADNVAGALEAGFDAVRFESPSGLERELRARGLLDAGDSR